MLRASLFACLAGACLGLAAAENPVAVPDGDTISIRGNAHAASGREPVAASNVDSDTADDTLTIGKRERLGARMTDMAFQAETARIAKELAATSISKESLDTLRDEIRRVPERSGVALAKCLDARQYDAETRRGAAKGIALSEASTKIVGKALGDAALIEPDAATRKELISTIQQRRDALALHSLMTHLEEASDPDGLGIVNEKQRDAALAALRDIGDKRIYQAVFYYTTLEIRTGTASLVSTDTKFITNSGDVSNGAVGRTTVNLPIELPTLELGSFQGTIVVPAICQPTGAMKKLTGQDFGKDLVKWQDWINKQPDVKK